MIDGINLHRFLRLIVDSHPQRFCRWSAVAATIALAATSATAHAVEAHYDCNRGAGLTARFSTPGATAGHVVLTFDETKQQIKLPQVMSADGGRYADGKIEFWIKGKGATLTRNGSSETCTSR